MAKKLIIIFLLFAGTISAQKFRERRFGDLPNRVNRFFSEVQIIPTNSGYTFYFAYKVPYNKLVFIKEGSSYTANFNMSVEVADTNTSFVVRDIQDKKITTESFKETNSEEIYKQGVIKLNLPSVKRHYNFVTVFTDLNSDNEITSPPRYFELPDSNKDFLQPLVVESVPIDCRGKKVSALSNFGDAVPFGKEKCDLLFITSDTLTHSIFVKIKNDDKSVISKELADGVIDGVSFALCSDNVILGNDNSIKYKIFRLKNVGSDVIEGMLSIKVSKNKNENHFINFNKHVVWYNKPVTLRDPENAIKLLKYMAPDSTIDKLLDAKKHDYEQELIAFWKKYDPTPGDTYNELMNEYYSRIDYALKNFSPITGKNGAESDRGRVFIHFGKPYQIERNSDSRGKIVETWIYKNPQRRFVFVDNKGTGEFLLKEG